MSIINLILLSLLILKSASQDDIDYSTKDREKCEKPNFTGEMVTPEKCYSLTSTLESTGKYKSDCCRISYKTDPLVYFKKSYGEKWKTIICQMYGLDPNISDKDLLKIFGMKDEDEKQYCTLLNKEQHNLQLYAISSSLEGINVNYNCGDGEESFSSKTFIPITDLEKKFTDRLDCQAEIDEKSCSKRPYRHLTDDIDCCWCELTQKVNGFESKAQLCVGYPSDALKEEIQDYINLRSKDQVIYRCSCFEKSGKNTRVSANSITGEVVLE